MIREHGSVPAAIHKKSRLPAGGSLHRCHCNDHVRRQHSNVIIPECGARPTCIVFDEVDPSTAQENISSTVQRKPAVQHRETQTEPIEKLEQSSSNSKKRPHLHKVTIVETKQQQPQEPQAIEQDECAPGIKRSEILPHERSEIKQPLSEYYYTSAASNRQDVGYKPRNVVETRDESNANKSEAVKPNQSEDRSIQFENRSLFNLNRQNITGGKRIWNPAKHFKHPTIVVPSERNTIEKDVSTISPKENIIRSPQRNKADLDEFYSCESIPKMNSQLGRMTHQVDRLEAGVNELQNNIAWLKSTKELRPIEDQPKKSETDRKKSKELIVVFNDGSKNACGQSENDWKVYRIPKTDIDASQRIPASHLHTIDSLVKNLSEPVKSSTDCPSKTTLVKPDCNAKERTLDPRIFTDCDRHHHGCSFLIKPSKTPQKSSNDCACKSTESQIQLRRQSAYFCKYCAADQPVLNDLTSEVNRLIGNRNLSDVQLAILLRPDNVYHISVQLKGPTRVLGCVLATNTAIHEAASKGFFDNIVTYCVVDVRNTIKFTGRPLGIPFQLGTHNSSRDRAGAEAGEPEKRNETLHKLDTRTQDFITKVLGVPADQIAVNLNKNSPPYSRLLLQKNLS